MIALQISTEEAHRLTGKHLNQEHPFSLVEIVSILFEVETLTTPFLRL